jgi:methyltransferase (TIGR00027 family)
MAMPDTGPSRTAARVAAYRLGLDRLALPAGDGVGAPDADERLAADVSGGITVDRSSLMGRHVRARTGFFDRVVVNALGRQVGQIVLIGAGYDGRALRYAVPGVQWWEVDRAGTLEDKRSRLDRLGLTAGNVISVAFDLADGGLATALTAAGFCPDAPALYLAEGIAPYLEAGTLRNVLRDLRSVATVGTRLAISFRRPGADARARADFEAGAGVLGEPAVGSVTTDDAEAMFIACRWRQVELSERAQASGFVVAAPVFAPAEPGVPPTAGRIGAFVEHMLYRRGGDTLADHLAATYGVAVTRAQELDVGVYGVQRADGSKWVARMFPSGRPVAAARGDAELLDGLNRHGIPAERTAAAEPVSVHEGQAVLVTEFAPGRRAAGRPAVFERLGAVLAHIHLLPAEDPPANRPGGAWHHLLPDATPTEELAAARELLHDARHRVPRGRAADYELLVGALAGLTLAPDLPTALVHPDLVPGNAVQAGNGALTVLDWAGAGRGPRLVSLGCLLWSAAGHGPSVDAAVRSYRSAVTLQSTELVHLETAMAVRPLVLACWSFATGRWPLAEAAAWWAGEQRRVAKAAHRARPQLSVGS